MAIDTSVTPTIQTTPLASLGAEIEASLTAHLGDAVWKTNNNAKVSTGVVSGNNLTLTMSDATTIIIDVTTLAGSASDVKVSSGAVVGNDLTLTLSDASTFVIDVTSLAEKTTVEDNLVSTSVSNALSANQGKELATRVTTLESDESHHPALTLTTNAGAVSLNEATQALNIPPDAAPHDAVSLGSNPVGTATSLVGQVLSIETTRTNRDSLTNQEADSTLSANQGFILDGKITAEATMRSDADALMEAAILVLEGLDHSEVTENNGVLSGVATAGSKWGIDTSTGQAYYVTGGNWAAMPISTIDLNMTVSDEAGLNKAASPASAPASPDTGDVHLEVYDDFLVWWSYGGAVWVSSAQVPTNPTAVSMTGATALTDGTGGSVPTPVAFENTKVLRGDGTWGPNVDFYIGNNEYSAGTVIIEAGQFYRRNIDGLSNVDFTSDAANWTAIGSSDLPWNYYDAGTTTITDEDQYAVIEAAGDYTLPTQTDGRNIIFAATVVGVNLKGTGAGDLAEFTGAGGTSIDQTLEVNSTFNLATIRGSVAGPWTYLVGAASAAPEVVAAATTIAANHIVQDIDGVRTLTMRLLGTVSNGDVIAYPVPFKVGTIPFVTGMQGPVGKIINANTLTVMNFTVNVTNTDNVGSSIAGLHVDVVGETP